MKAINVDAFSSDGRGPELVQTFWSPDGTILKGIEYRNPGDNYANDLVRHVSFKGTQVVMMTPEEVINYAPFVTGEWVRGAAMYDQGQSTWFKGFNPRHLGQCSHYSLLFYDQLFDVICEEVECGVGPFRN